MLYFKKDVIYVWNAEVLNVGNMPEKKYRYFFHWVRQTNKWSVHFQKKCTHATYLECQVPCESKNNKRQPYRVMQGFATSVEVINDKIIIK